MPYPSAAASEVLARRLLDTTGNGYLPVERFASNAVGQLTSLEPSTGPRLPGIAVPGTYRSSPSPAEKGSSRARP